MAAFSSARPSMEQSACIAALVQSCDTFFYNVGNRMDIDDIAHYAEMVGYGHKTGIDLPHEAEGVVPSTAMEDSEFPREMVSG